MEKLIYRAIESDELKPELFRYFNRHQVVNRCWRKVEGEWILKDIHFTEKWSIWQHIELTKYLKNTLATGGIAYGVFDQNRLIGFTSVENEPFGSENQYLELSCIHTSYEYRGQGIGKELFKKCCTAARQRGAKKLYISAHSCEESQAFYKKMGCTDALEYNQKLVEREPCDRHLEYVL